MSDKMLKCSVCGVNFEACVSCEKNNLISWKTVTESENHFNIYVILHRYNVTKKITKEQAKDMLLKCDLTDYENFKTISGELIAKILKEDSVAGGVKTPTVTNKIVEEVNTIKKQDIKK